MDLYPTIPLYHIPSGKLPVCHGKINHFKEADSQNFYGHFQTSLSWKDPPFQRGKLTEFLWPFSIHILLEGNMFKPNTGHNCSDQSHTASVALTRQLASLERSLEKHSEGALKLLHLKRRGVNPKKIKHRPLWRSQTLRAKFKTM